MNVHADFCICLPQPEPHLAQNTQLNPSRCLQEFPIVYHAATEHECIVESPPMCLWLVMCECKATLCFATVLGFNRLCNWLVCRNTTTMCGKIQGDGRKFLHRFKSYFGPQIPPQPLNDVHIYRIQPKSATKGEIFFTHFCL